MKIVLPKKLIHNLAHEHLSLLDPACKARGNASHYILSTNVTGCGTRSHEYKNFIVYTNMVIESPDDGTDVITHVGKNEIKVPFSCYYNDLEIVHAVGFQPTAEKIHVYVQGRGRYALSLDIFKDRTFGDGPNVRVSQPKFTEADFPISVQLRERVHVQASLDTRETDLKIFLSNCCSTPTQDHEATIKFRHPLIVEGYDAIISFNKLKVRICKYYRKRFIARYDVTVTKNTIFNDFTETDETGQTNL